MNILKNKGVQGAIVALVLAIAAALGLQGCASFGKLDPKAQRAVDVFECYVQVLEPYVGEVCDTADLVRDHLSGKGDAQRTLILLGVRAPEIAAIGAQLGACINSEPDPEPEALPALTPA